MSSNDKTFDVRTLEHKLRRGEITRKQVREYLAALPDETAHGAESEVKFTNPYEQRQGERSEDDAAGEG